MPEQYIEIGKISKPYGINGQVKVLIEDQYLLSLKKLKFIFIDLDGSIVPFNIVSRSYDPNILLKLEEVDSPEDVAPLINRSVFIHPKDFDVDENVPKDPMLKYVGFVIVDDQDNRIGIIERVEEYPQQLMATVLTETSDSILIPLVESYITSIDMEAKRIEMDMPEGLLSL